MKTFRVKLSRSRSIREIFLTVHDCNMDERLESSWRLVYYQVSGEPGIARCIVVDRTFNSGSVDLRASLFTDHRRVILFFAFNFRGWSRQRNYFNSEIFPIYCILVNALVVLVFACYCNSVVNCMKLI